MNREKRVGPGQILSPGNAKISHLLLVALLILTMGSSFYQPVQLGAPPVWTNSAPRSARLVSPLAEGDLALFLPFVAVPVPPPPDMRKIAVDLWVNSHLPSENVDMAWTGNHDTCNPGNTSQAYKDAVLLRINYFRLAAGVPALTGLNPTFNQKAQAAAFMMSRNNRLSHFPGILPDDPANWVCFSLDGQEGAGSSNLALGTNGASTIDSYIQDSGNGNEPVGHRRWLLHPPSQEMGTGDIPWTGTYRSSNALYVFDGHTFDPRPPVRDDFVAWPPKGHIPYQVVFQRWSFGYPDADFSGAQVRVTQNGADLPLVQYAPDNGFGENTLVWEMTGIDRFSTWPKPAADLPCVVTIQNVLINGQPRDFTYEVIIIDPDS